MITIKRSVDIEDEIRQALKDYIPTYCRPLPAKFETPCVLVTQVGGLDAEGEIDTFEVVLDVRAKTDAEANETMRNAIGVLRKVTKEQQTALRHIEVNSSGGWGSDPARPDLKLFTARISAVAHLEETEIGGVKR